MRAWAPANPIPAFRHAARIIHLEEITHIDIEVPINHVFSTHALLGSFSGYWYAILHFLVTPIVLLWLWRWRPTVFPRLRSTLVLMSVVSLGVFWLFPVAPPRFVVPGMTDILVQRKVVESGPAHGISGFVDLYAAVPSLHVAWAAWCALAVVCAFDTPWRHLAWLYPPTTTLVVIGTANHYVIDAVAGIAAPRRSVVGDWRSESCRSAGERARTPSPRSERGRVLAPAGLVGQIALELRAQLVGRRQLVGVAQGRGLSLLGEERVVLLLDGSHDLRHLTR